MTHPHSQIDAKALEAAAMELCGFAADQWPRDPVPGLMREDYRERAARVISAYLSTLHGQQSEAVTPVAVKPLEWDAREKPDHNGNRYWRAQTTFDWGYRVYLEDGRYVWQHNNADFDTLEAAQQAVQADYEARILSALIPAAKPAMGVVEAIKRLQWIVAARWDENADLDAICTYAGQAVAALTAPAGDGDGLSEWTGWDQDRYPWGETKHKDAVLEALFRGPWSVEDAAALLGFIDRTWTRRAIAASTAGEPK